LAVIANRVQTETTENLLRAIVVSRHDGLQHQRDVLVQDKQLYESAREFLRGYEYFTKMDNVLISTDGWPPPPPTH
jgi:hypothetical protein